VGILPEVSKNIVMRKKVFFGLSNTANVANSIARSLRSVGVKAYSYEYSQGRGKFNPASDKEFPLLNIKRKIRIFGKNITSIVNTLLKYYYLLKSAIYYDVFFFVRHSTFLPDLADFKILKLLRKKVYILFVGCPERDPAFAGQEFDYLCNYCKDTTMQIRCFCNDKKYKSELVNRYQSYCDGIFAYDDVGGLLKEKPLFWMTAVDDFIPDDLTGKFDEDKIVICHLPSNPLYKQTDIISAVLNEIAEKYKEVEIVIKKDYWSREQIISTLKRSHIFVESLSGITYGVIGAEAMSAGCVVMSSYPEFISKNYDIHAVVKVTSQTLFTTLCSYIEDREKLRLQAAKSIAFYKKYHTYVAAGNYYKDKLGL
jgi:hypothetical protein